jgi:epoxyqueuosine reductase
VVPHALAIAVKQKATELGFDLCGIAPARPSPNREHVRRWLDAGKHATMAWLAKRFEERTDVEVYVPGAKSVVVVALLYRHPESCGGLDTSNDGGSEQQFSKHVPDQLPELQSSSNGVLGKVARYARGTDYHDLLKKRLHTLADHLRTLIDCETRACVDTAPVLERELAQAAGIAWQGKNTLAIHPKLGSYFYLGEIITTAELAADEPHVDRCGTCTRCIDACPTDAITPYEVDARRCISYATIEHRGETLPVDTGDWLFGCDICQEVCPWNTRAPFATDAATTPKPNLAAGVLDAAAVAFWTSEEYQQTLRGTAMKRVKLPMFQRNARVVMKHHERMRDA